MEDSPTLEEIYRRKWLKALSDVLQSGGDIIEWQKNWSLGNPPPPNENPIIKINKKGKIHKL